MIGDRYLAQRVRRWGIAGMAGGAAVAAAMLGVAGAPGARADTIDELLVQSEGDMTQAADLFSAVDTSSLSDQQASGIEGIVSGLQNQGDLISQIQSEQDGLSEAVQTSSQVLDADQQLATASGDLVSSSNTFVNALDAGDFPLFHASSLAGDVTGFEAAFGLVDTELFQVVPAEVDALFAPLAAGFDAGLTGSSSDTAGTSATEVATSAAAGADASAGADLASSLDPSAFIDAALASLGL